MKHSGALKKLIKKILYFAENKMAFEMNFVNEETHPVNMKKAKEIIIKRQNKRK